MINKIIDGICVAIDSEFGDSYEIYTESIEQGLVEPCFSILCLNPTINQVLGNRYFRTHQFCIHYFPSSSDGKSECYSVVERLMDCLETIEVDGDSVMGTKIHAEITNGVLSVFVNYNMYVRKENPAEPSMEEVSHNSTVKG